MESNRSWITKFYLTTDFSSTNKLSVHPQWIILLSFCPVRKCNSGILSVCLQKLWPWKDDWSRQNACAPLAVNTCVVARLYLYVIIPTMSFQFGYAWMNWKLWNRKQKRMIEDIIEKCGEPRPLDSCDKFITHFWFGRIICEHRSVNISWRQSYC